MLEPGLSDIASSRTTLVLLYTPSFLQHQSLYLDNLSLIIPFTGDNLLIQQQHFSQVGFQYSGLQLLLLVTVRGLTSISLQIRSHTSSSDMFK